MKKVRFDPNDKILKMCVWSFAYHEARKCDWLQITADRYRFSLRKQRIESELVKIGFFSRHSDIYRFDLRQQKLESLLTKIGYFSR